MRNDKMATIEGDNVYVLQPGTSIYVKTADICSMLGCSNQWVGQLTSQGTLVKRATPYGKMYEVLESVRAYSEVLEQRADKRMTESEKKVKDARDKAEMQIKAARAMIAKLEANELQGKMHRAEDVQMITEDMANTLRSLLLALPGRLAVDVSNAKSAAEASVIIKEAVHEIMREMSKYQYDPARYDELVRERMKWEVTESVSSNE